MKLFLRNLPRIGAPIFAIAIGLLVIVFTLGVFSDRPLIEADLSTYVLPAVERGRGFGSVYVDFLDIKPPLTFAFFVPWIAVVGPSLAGLWLLYVLLLSAMLTAFWLLLRMELSSEVALVLFGSCAAIVVWFVMLEEFFFTTEVIGMTFILRGLVVARRFSQYPLALAVAAWLLGSAGQVKEVFIFMPLALVPIAWSSSTRVRACAALAGGWIAAIAMTAAVLVWWGEGALSAYLDVVAIKRERFPMLTISSFLASVWEQVQAFSAWLPLLGVFALGVITSVALAARHPRTGARSSAWRLTPGEWTMAAAFSTAVLGFAWQAAEPSKYYAVALVYPLFLALAVALRYGMCCAELAPRRGVVILKAVLLVGVLPPFAALLWFGGRTVAAKPVEDVRQVLAAESTEDKEQLAAIGALVPPGGCLHVAYGFSATSIYLYSGAPPCTRFTAPPLASATDVLAREFREALLDRPPNVLVMDPSLKLLASTEEGRREWEDFPLDVVARDCFKPTLIPNTFVPVDDELALRACMAERLPSKGEVDSAVVSAT